MKSVGWDKIAEARWAHPTVAPLRQILYNMPFSRYPLGKAMKTLISENQLREGIDRIAKEIREQYQGRPLTIVGVLIGSVVFLADLIRQIDLPMRLELVQARSYRGTSTR